MLRKLMFVFIGIGSPGGIVLSLLTISLLRRLPKQSHVSAVWLVPPRYEENDLGSGCRIVRSPDKINTATRKGAGKAYISFQRSELRWSGLRSNFTPRLHEITVPTLLVYGAEDTAVPLAHVQQAHALIPHSELYIMQECRHWPQGEKPEEFTRVVGNFLDV